MAEQEVDLVHCMVKGALEIIATAPEEVIVSALKQLSREERWKFVRAAWISESLPTQLPEKAPSIHEELGVLGQ